MCQPSNTLSCFNKKLLFYSPCSGQIIFKDSKRGGHQTNGDKWKNTLKVYKKYKKDFALSKEIKGTLILDS